MKENLFVILGNKLFHPKELKKIVVKDAERISKVKQALKAYRKTNKNFDLISI